MLGGFLCLIALGVAQSTPIIVLDPGHPSEVGPGTRGKYMSEIDAAWKVATTLAPLLRAKGYRVEFTKPAPQTLVTNKERAARANQVQADLMVRLHCDHALGDSGFATFYADRQGKHSGKVGPLLETIAKTKRMAGPFHRAVMAKLKGDLADRGLRTDRQTNVGAKYGALIGSIHCDRPSILVEMCVLSTKKDEDFIRTASGQSKMAVALAAGIDAALASVSRRANR